MSARSAPFVFIEYSHDSEAHQQRVLAIAEDLRRHGIECRLDRWAKRPHEGWERWFEAHLDEAEVVLLVCSRMLAERLGDAAQPDSHDWEARLVRERLHRPRPQARRLVAVLLEGATETEVPQVARGAAIFRLPQQTAELFRSLDVGAAPPSSSLGAFEGLGAQLSKLRDMEREAIINDGDADELKKLQAAIGDLERLIAEGPPLRRNDTLGDRRYQLLETVGSGGFGEVWRAFDTREPALAAVKVLRSRYAQDHTRRERFFRGAQQMARLRHPNIVRVREQQGIEGNRCYFVMDYVSGGDLSKKVGQNRLSAAKVVAIITALGEAIQHAHDRGLVHRDIKPENVVIDVHGNPLLTDFDLAQAKDMVAGTAGGVGTFGYAAPEALQDGALADPGSDQYSLAMTAAFLFLGKELPRTEAVFSTTRFVRELPCSIFVKQVLLRALSMSKKDRYGSVRELCDALNEAAQRAEPSMADSLEAVVFTRSGAVSFPLPKSGPVSIGRNPGNWILIEDPTRRVSGAHALLQVGSKLSVEDLGSRNKTSVLHMAAISHEGTVEVVEVGPHPVVIDLGDVIVLGQNVEMIVRRATTSDHRASAGPPNSRTPPVYGEDPVIAGPAMRELFERVDALAAGSEPILLVGERGVGKATLALEIHRRSPRVSRPFLVLNCRVGDRSQVARTLVGESSTRLPVVGLLESARGSTVFLDEIDALHAAQQAELLRALDEGKVLRLGGTTERAVDQRLVCSATRDLQALVNAGKFSRELHQRITRNVLAIPPLRDRREDLAALARSFAVRAAVQYDRVMVPVLSDEALKALQRYDWPDNVRGLRNVIERAVAVCGGTEILLDHLPPKITRGEDAS